MNKTAQQINQPPEVILHVLKHVFSYIRQYILFPTSSGIRIPYWGVLRPDTKALRLWLRHAIKRLRKDPNQPLLKERFLYYWKLRILAKKDNERRKFKKRFGSWHWK